MKIDKSLFADLSAKNMESQGFPPLTANIYTYLLFDYEHQGITFDELTAATCASKSSISNALNRLLQGNYIEYFTKLDERKRYYRINKSIFKIQFINSIHQLKEENQILKRLAEHRVKTMKYEDNETKKIKLHIGLQEKTIALYEETLRALNKIK
ncbi:hypothetical protein GO491_00135 [Flavobacteriaceae bacterium Ap0902]|nr:hypothetical protein [Flavobacteriaceae bacterium Ap0902]